MGELLQLLLFIAYIGGCWKAARIANDKGHTAYYVLVVSILLTPIAGIPMAMLLKDHRPEGKECPFCKEMIYKEAIVCKHCG